MPLWAAFCGGAYRSRSRNIAADECHNLYPEVTEISTEVKEGVLYGTPGLKFLLHTSESACRGNFSQDALTVSVIGGTVYVVDVAGANASAVGSLANDGKPVSFACNGHGGEQLVMVGGGQLKVLNLITHVLSAGIALPLSNAPVQVEFIDGYFILSEADSLRVWFSAIEDGTLWDALDFFAVSLTSSNVVGIKALRDRIWVFQSQTTVLYYESGDLLNPFVPYPGSVMQEGASTPWGITIQGEQIYWLAQDNQGRARMVTSGDSSAVAISTVAISFELSSYSRLDDAEVLSYEQEGHPFIAWTFPSAETTWVYDTREQLWHQRDYWNQSRGIATRWRARGICSTGQSIVVGDCQTGDLYTLDLDTFTDNGAIIRRMRQAPYLGNENQWFFLNRVELGIESGVGLNSGQGSDPQLMLEVSGDSGHSFGPVTTAPMGKMGEYQTLAQWFLLGRHRLDRLVLRVTQTDPVRAVWGPGLWLRGKPGTGQL